MSWQRARSRPILYCRYAGQSRRRRRFRHHRHAARLVRNAPPRPRIVVIVDPIPRNNLHAGLYKCRPVSLSPLLGNPESRRQAVRGNLLSSEQLSDGRFQSRPDRIRGQQENRGPSEPCASAASSWFVGSRQAQLARSWPCSSMSSSNRPAIHPRQQSSVHCPRLFRAIAEQLSSAPRPADARRYCGISVDAVASGMRISRTCSLRARNQITLILFWQPDNDMPNIDRIRRLCRGTHPRSPPDLHAHPKSLSRK